MSKAKLYAARELIEEKRYDAARAVLNTIPADPKAQEWLQKLPKKRGNAGNWLVIVLVFILGFAFGAYEPNPSNRNTASVVAQPTSVPRSSTRAAPTDTITPSPTVNFSAQTQGALSGEETRAALNAVAQATNLALTLPPTQIPPTQAPIIFEGSTAQVLGPITMSPGLYRARVVTAGFFIATLQITDGECGTGSFILSPTFFNLMAGGGQPAAEATIRSEGCTAYIETSNISDSWRLEISPLS